MVSSGEASTASWASAFARKKRVREWWLALIAEKNRKRSRARALGRPHQAQRGERVQLLDRGARLVADRGRHVHDRVDAAQRVAERGRVREVAERDLHAHALLAEAARVAHERAHRAGRPP